MSVEVSVAPFSGRRERRRAETMNRIVTEAMQLFGERGYADTTVEDITEAADIGKGTFFNYFPTKDAVLLEIFDAIRQKFVDFEAGLGAVTDVRTSLQAFTHATLDSVAKWPRLISGVLGHALTDPVMGKRIEGIHLQARKTMTKLFQRGQGLGQVRGDIPAPVLARTYQQFIVGTQFLWALNPGGNLHQWVDVMMATFWEGAVNHAGLKAGKEKK